MQLGLYLQLNFAAGQLRPAVTRISVQSTKYLVLSYELKKEMPCV